MSQAVGTLASGGSGTQTPARTLTVGSGAFTNMADLTTVKLPKDSNINPTYFGNPTTEGTTPKLTSITYGDGTATATATIGDANISSTNFSKIKNQTIQINSSTSSAISFTGGVFNNNSTMTKLMLNVTQNPRNGSGSL